ncbi:DUF262 domain-containing protein, partial [Candidatus Poribacteria bacterium]|nr:DUF262 domain-containing protein [Candidatus Poribacteria bacterium]
GRIQLPDFQRDWIWDDYRIRSLLASVSQAFPIGAVLTLAVDSKNSLTRLVEGVNREKVIESPNTLILDGQQRLTALFQSLKFECGVYTKNKDKTVTRYYYLDIKKRKKSKSNCNVIKVGLHFCIIGTIFYLIRESVFVIIERKQLDETPEKEH